MRTVPVLIAVASLATGCSGDRPIETTEAAAAPLRRVPGGTVLEAELGDQDGTRRSIRTRSASRTGAA
jgi:hypothetical protein